MARDPLRLLRACARRLPRLRARSGAWVRGVRPRLRPVPSPSITPTPHPFGRALGLVAVTLFGAWLGLLVVGDVRAPVGPMDTTMTLRPSVSGGTKVNVSPLGALELASHRAPLRLDVAVDELDPERSRALVDHPERISGLEHQVTEDVQRGTTDLALRASVSMVSGATALGLAVYRRPRRALAAGGLALLLLASSAGSAYATWNPKSVLEPKFSGLLSSAPSVVGNARSIVTDFDIYQQELARLVTNLTKLYDATSTLPTYQPDPSTMRVLHVSDLHLNPVGWQVIHSLVEQYGIDVVIDSGDTMDHGTSAENGYLDPATGLDAPYVWVRGNHDSETTQRYLSKLDNVHVLDHGKPVEIDGLRIAGMGDPQFTPDRSIVPEGDPSERRAGRQLAAALRAQEMTGNPVDIAVAHNPVAAKETDGQVPLVLAGHTHHRSTEVLPDGTRLMIEGTTGGGGLRAVEGSEPQKVAATVLYLDRETHRLQAWDEITLGGLGLTSAEVSRHLPGDQKPASSPSPTEQPSTPSTERSSAQSTERSTEQPSVRPPAPSTERPSGSPPGPPADRPGSG